MFSCSFLNVDGMVTTLAGGSLTFSGSGPQAESNGVNGTFANVPNAMLIDYSFSRILVAERLVLLSLLGFYEHFCFCSLLNVSNSTVIRSIPLHRNPIRCLSSSLCPTGTANVPKCPAGLRARFSAVFIMNRNMVYLLFLLFCPGYYCPSVDVAPVACSAGIFRLYCSDLISEVSCLPVCHFWQDSIVPRTVSLRSHALQAIIVPQLNSLLPLCVLQVSRLFMQPLSCFPLTDC